MKKSNKHKKSFQIKVTQDLTPISPVNGDVSRIKTESIESEVLSDQNNNALKDSVISENMRTLKSELDSGLDKKSQLYTNDSNYNLKQNYDFTLDIIDKQYRSYVWNDGKIQALVTIDTALIAGILLVLQTLKIINVFVFILLALSFIFLLISFLVCLIHAIPRIHSGVGNQANLRTMVGINRFSKEEYNSKILELDLAEMLRMNCWQITGMCKNNMRSHELIKFGVIFTIIGVLFFASGLPIIVYDEWNQRNISSEIIEKQKSGNAIQSNENIEKKIDSTITSKGQNKDKLNSSTTNSVNINNEMKQQKDSSKILK